MSRILRLATPLRLLLAGGAILAAGLVLVATWKYGAGTTPDSVSYISVARNLAAGHGYQTFEGEAAAYWPPLIPLLLTVSAKLHIEPLIAFRFLNATCFGIIVLLTGRIFARNGSPAGAAGGMILAVLCFPVYFISKYAWSEALFIVWCLLFLIATVDYGRVPSGGAFRRMALYAALACLTRYIGVILLPLGVIWLCTNRAEANRRWMMQAVIFAVLGSAPVYAWWLRNRAATGTFMGERSPSSSGIVDNLRISSDVVSQWILPAGWPLGLRIALLTVLAAGFVWLLRRVREKKMTLAALSFGAFYALDLIVSASRYEVDRLDTRLWAPIAIVLVWCLADVMQLLSAKARRVVTALLAVLAIHPAILIASDLRDSIHDGAGGYASGDWQDSGLMDDVRAQPPADKLFSNAAPAVYLLTGHPVESLPDTGTPEQMDDPIQDALDEDKPVRLAWFNIEDSVKFMRLEDLRRGFQLKELEHEDEGELFEILPLGVP